MMLLAVDPGADQGWALFESGCLVACGLGAPPVRAAGARTIIERPHPIKTRAPVKDIITLAIRAGETGGARRVDGAEVEYVEPATWMGGSIPTKVNQARIRRRLSGAERDIVEAAEKAAKSKAHNVLDAVGIGLFASKRKG